MQRVLVIVVASWLMKTCFCRDEEKISKACYWPNEVYEPCFGGCAEVSCDNPRNHLRPCYPYCEPGCVCDEPYVRDDRTHQCVLPSDCSQTQMGIPVNTKRNKAPLGKFEKTQRSQKRSEAVQELPAENEEPPSSRTEYTKRGGGGSEVSRMGNYFNIVIAPPPIKALTPRKLLHDNDGFRPAQKSTM